MRFPDLLVEFSRLQNRVTLLISDVEQMRRELHAVTPVGIQSLVSRETSQLSIDDALDPEAGK